MLRPLRLALPAAFVAVSSCLAPAFAALPPLVPRQVLFGDPARSAPRLSPDGTRLCYSARSKEGVLNVWVRTVGRNDDRQVTHDLKRGVDGAFWSPDGKRLLYVRDRDGDEDWHLRSIDLETGLTRDLTPFEGVRAENVLTDLRHPDEVLVGLNLRDRRVADMYRVNLATGAVVEDTRNPGDVVEWATDHAFVIRAAAALDPKDASAVIRVRDSAEAPWRTLRVWPFLEANSDRYQRIVGFTRDGDSLLVQSPVGANTTRIVAIDLASGGEREVVPADPRSDLWGRLDYSAGFEQLVLLLHPERGTVQAYGVNYLKPEWRVVDPALRADFDALARVQPGVFLVMDRDRADRRWLVGYVRDDGPVTFYLYERRTRRAEKLYVTRPELLRHRFARLEAVTFRARDGLEIPAYLTLPPGVPKQNLPLVLVPHGGPWYRDQWGFDTWTQWLANRGYAVLQVQFRGSTGFGKAFLNASNGEMGTGAMQHDLTDAVGWAVSEGIADPGRVAIVGGSYGGYAVLCGLAFTPELYACGVDVVGPSNVRTLIQSFPPYWAPRQRRWLLRIGDVLEDDALNRRISPLFHVDRMKAPLLIGHGANDPRVKLAESEQIVKSMRERGLDVTFVVYPDEGHGFGRDVNDMDFNGRIEEFLAKHLGGRFEPWVKHEGTTAEVR